MVSAASRALTLSI